MQRFNDTIVTMNKKVVIYFASFDRCRHLMPIIKLPENHRLLTAFLPLHPTFVHGMLMARKTCLHYQQMLQIDREAAAEDIKRFERMVALQKRNELWKKKFVH